MPRHTGPAAGRLSLPPWRRLGTSHADDSSLPFPVITPSGLPGPILGKIGTPCPQLASALGEDGCHSGKRQAHMPAVPVINSSENSLLFPPLRAMFSSEPGGDPSQAYSDEVQTSSPRRSPSRQLTQRDRCLWFSLNLEASGTKKCCLLLSLRVSEVTLKVEFKIPSLRGWYVML